MYEKRIKKVFIALSDKTYNFIQPALITKKAEGRGQMAEGKKYKLKMRVPILSLSKKRNNILRREAR